MKESTKTLMKYLQQNNDIDQTAADVAEVLQLSKKSVDGSFTAAIQRKGLGFREEVKVADGDEVKTVKFLRLTAEGMAFDVDADTE